MMTSIDRPATPLLSYSTARQLGFLGMFTAFCASLVALRFIWTGTGTYGFLAWNLFLAWVPVACSTLAAVLYGRTQRFLAVVICMVPWLLFLPNAPYIVTDLVHLRPRPGIPYWYDILLIASFAFHGLVLGFYSMRQMHSLVSMRFRPFYGWALMFLASVGAAYGIYLGRVLRWNSWDLLRHPFRIMLDSLGPFIHPFAHKEAVVMTVVLSAFLFIGYLASHIGRIEKL